MAKATIGLVDGTGQVHSLYLRHDGDPHHAGRLLLAHYGAHERVTELLATGPVASLAATPAECRLYHPSYYQGVGKKAAVQDWPDLPAYFQGAARATAFYAYYYRAGSWRVHILKGVRTGHDYSLRALLGPQRGSVSLTF